jgi:hypothetical protein
VAPDEDGADRKPHFLGDGRVGLTVGDTQDDLGTIRGLLGGGPGGHDALQFSAFGGRQTDTSTTGLERGMCAGAFDISGIRREGLKVIIGQTRLGRRRVLIGEQRSRTVKSP